MRKKPVHARNPQSASKKAIAPLPPTPPGRKPPGTGPTESRRVREFGAGTVLDRRWGHLL